MLKKPNFIGLDTRYLSADGKQLRRVHLDGAASPLASAKAIETVNKLLPHYSNTHSYVHSSAQISTQALAWAHRTVLEFVGAAQDEYAAIFSGAGTTAAINRVARGLATTRAERKIVLVSAMEHHANDLPHRQFANEVIYLPLSGEGANTGAIDLEKLAQLCQQHQNQVNYIAVSSVSNVTGISNPITEICRIAHQYNILVLVDGAQSVAHGPTELAELDADFFVFSGHKTYAPMSPGVLIARKNLLGKMPGQDLGGGSVSTVSYYDFEFVDDASEREESGTPNIIGAIALAAVLDELKVYGLDKIHDHDAQLMVALKAELEQIPEVTVYGDSDLPRTGALAFNYQGIDHGLLAAILNDYYAIAVRNECFCAHPYVSSLLKDELWQLDLSEIAEDQQESYLNRKRGMVRASLSLYNDEKDISQLCKAIREIGENSEFYSSHYQARADGSYRHKNFSLDWRKELGLASSIRYSQTD